MLEAEEEVAAVVLAVVVEDASDVLERVEAVLVVVSSNGTHWHRSQTVGMHANREIGQGSA